MTTTQVRSHTRRLPDKDRLKDLAFRDEIEARKAEKSKRIKAPEDWYRGPKLTREEANRFMNSWLSRVTHWLIDGGKQT